MRLHGNQPLENLESLADCAKREKARQRAKWSETA
jgi:hypothetical protein